MELPLAGSLKLRICTVLEAGPGSTSESGVAMMVISATVVWKLDSSLLKRDMLKWQDQSMQLPMWSLQLLRQGMQLLKGF